ncbi:hypothetical protein Pint_19241 [Pistacia integerrima]|uniref:Uncharacterized protein n=1 Tax=Pistacia integerrima TaxID=434235 RepID=A0ACC0Z2I4_9ROSI|nr:hypothetical protein Pint_19241 [Pistacia integerrima]
MAEVSILPAEVLLSKRVQEMVLKGEEPPPPYVCRDGDAVHEVAAPFSMIPTIDLSLCALSTPGMEQEEELQKLKSALCSWGCFQAVGHGISSTFAKFQGNTSNSPWKRRRSKRKELKISKAMELTLYLKKVNSWIGLIGSSLKYTQKIEEILNYGQKNQNLSGAFMLPIGILEQYSIKMKKVTELTSKAMAKSLNIEENCFLTQFGERAQHKARFNYYSRCQRPDLVLGLKAHSDVSGFTIILMDEEGLQVLKDEQWFTVPKITEALLVLMGDQMEIMTNGIFKSPVHRVVTSSERERISIAVFYSPEANKEIGPEDGLINEETPRLFKNVKGYADIYQG